MSRPSLADTPPMRFVSAYTAACNLWMSRTNYCRFFARCWVNYICRLYSCNKFGICTICWNYANTRPYTCATCRESCSSCSSKLFTLCWYYCVLCYACDNRLCTLSTSWCKLFNLLVDCSTYILSTRSWLFVKFNLDSNSRSSICLRVTAPAPAPAPAAPPPTPVDE